MPNKQQKLNYIHLIGGEKGGVGKTFVSRSLCQYLNAEGREFTLVEADSQVNDVGRIYQSLAQDTHTITLSDNPNLATEPDVIFNAATDAEVVVNLPSNTLDALNRWMAKVSLLDFMRNFYGGNRIVKWFVSDGCYESVRQLHSSIEEFDYGIPHIVVLNEGRLNGANFDYLSEDPLYQDVKNAPNFLGEMYLPALESAVQFFTDRNELTLEEAQEKIQDEQGILATQRVKTFLDGLTQAFDGIFDGLEKKLKALDDAQSGMKTDNSGKGVKTDKGKKGSKSSNSSSGKGASSDGNDGNNQSSKSGSGESSSGSEKSEPEEVAEPDYAG
jgi:hypothetical protein